jgi:DNA-binding beta-propeller fold protein YncE
MSNGTGSQKQTTAARGTHVSRAMLMLCALALALCAFSFFLVAGLASPSHAIASKAWTAVGSQGDKPGLFQQPRGVTSFPDGSYVVVDRSARVQLFSADNQPLKCWSMKDHDLGNPKGLCAMPNGHLLICDTHYGRVIEMTVDGAIVKIWGQPGRGNSEFTHPLSAAVDEKRGVAYVVEYGDKNDRVQKFKLDGTFIKAWGSFGDGEGQFQRPSGVALDVDGNVYVADACNHRVVKFDCEGKLLKTFGTMGRAPGELRYPYDIACGPDDLLYIAEFNNHRVSIYDREGVFQRVIGSPGSGQAEFANPWSLTIDSRGRLLVSDTGNYRVQIFDLKHGRKDRVAATPASAGQKQ